MKRDIILIVASFAISYLAFAFVRWELNFLEWGDKDIGTDVIIRLIYLAVSILTSLYAISAEILKDDK